MVQRPSWQAQLSGQKIWTLVPPPECEHVCRSLQVTVTKGDISKSAAEMNSMITKRLLVGWDQCFNPFPAKGFPIDE